MQRDAVKRCSTAIALGVCVVVSATVESGLPSAKGEGVPPADYIQAEVKGRIGTAPVTEAQHTGLKITAGAVTWEVDASASETLLKKAAHLDGKLAVARGLYSERRAGSGVRRILTLHTLAAGKGGDDYMDVTVRGTLKRGVMAVGAETTGVTITAGALTWELAMEDHQYAAASKLDGSKAIVTGRLRHQVGVEVKNRYIVNVRRIRPAMLEMGVERQKSP